jgi:putative ABC transport system substrate-binding protein
LLVSQIAPTQCCLLQKGSLESKLDSSVKNSQHGLVRRQVSVIVASPNYNSALAAKAATATIPILFMVAEDPAKLGLVASLNRSGGNATSVNYFIVELVAKRMGLLRELVPAAAHFGVLVNPNAASAQSSTNEAITAASALGVHADIRQARDEHEIETAFTEFAYRRTDALVVLPDTFLVSRRGLITALAARHAIPAIYAVREYVEAGGLISYGTSLTEIYRQLGLYTAHILKGAKPADLPVVQATKFEMAINVKAAKALGLNIPDKLLALADEVIE